METLWRKDAPTSLVCYNIDNKYLILKDLNNKDIYSNEDLLKSLNNEYVHRIK